MSKILLTLESNPTRIRPRARRFACAAIFIAIASGLLLLAFRNLGDWLATDEPLHHSDAIVVLGGGLPFRAMEAASLYKAGWAPEVWLTQGRSPTDGDLALEKLGLAPRSEYETSREVLLKLGVPSTAIQIVPGFTENTVAELGAVFRYAKPDPAMPVILVGSKSQARRVRIVWNAVSGGRLQAVVRYGEDDPFDPSHWWSNSTDALEVTREVGGILNAWVGFRISPRKH